MNDGRSTNDERRNKARYDLCDVAPVVTALHRIAVHRFDDSTFAQWRSHGLDETQSYRDYFDRAFVRDRVQFLCCWGALRRSALSGYRFKKASSCILQINYEDDVTGIKG